MGGGGGMRVPVNLHFKTGSTMYVSAVQLCSLLLALLAFHSMHYIQKQTYNECCDIGTARFVYHDTRARVTLWQVFDLMSPLHQLGRARWSLLHGMDKVAEKALDLGLVISEEVSTVVRKSRTVVVVLLVLSYHTSFLLHRCRVHSLYPPFHVSQL